MTKRFTYPLLACALAGFFSVTARTVLSAAEPPAQASADVVARGAYLVRTMGCNDCHTPLKMGPKGPEPDMTRALTGHPSDLVMPPAPKLQGPWGWSGAVTNTAFGGPWGTSFTANLTPDMETGLGKWTEEMFVATMRTGKHQGKGRPVLPPMPWFVVGALNDQDIHALWSYLRSLPPATNKVPVPVDPIEEGTR